MRITGGLKLKYLLATGKMRIPDGHLKFTVMLDLFGQLVVIEKNDLTTLRNRKYA